MVERYLAKLAMHSWNNSGSGPGLALGTIRAAGQRSAIAKGDIAGRWDYFNTTICCCTILQETALARCCVGVEVRRVRAYVRSRGIVCSGRPDHGHQWRRVQPVCLTFDRSFGIQTPRQHATIRWKPSKRMPGGAGGFCCPGGKFAQATPTTRRTHQAFNSARQGSMTSSIAAFMHGRDALFHACLGRTDIDLQTDRGEGRIRIEDSFSKLNHDFLMASLRTAI